MKKRYMIATAATLMGGAMLVEMQVGSKGLDHVEFATAGGGGGGGAGAAAGPLAGGGAVPAAVRGAEKQTVAKRAVTPEAEEPVILTAQAEADSLALMESASGWGEPAPFDGVLVQGGIGRSDAGLGSDVGVMGFVAGVPASYPLAGDINRASGADAVGTALAQPMALSTVPEPATWLSLIVGMAMVGFNLRRRQGKRSVAS